jgi:inorganic pyrophosphatase
MIIKSAYNRKTTSLFDGMILISLGIVIILTLYVTGFVDNVSSGLKYKDQYTLVGPEDFLKSIQPINSDGTINVLIEIPAGTTAKWELDKKDGLIKWKFKNGKPRHLKYIGYPGNYGMIPQTLQPIALGGDGEALDALVLGASVPRGSVVKVKLIGLMKFLDGAEKDHKLLAVLSDTPFFEINSILELDQKFEGTSKIIEIWFTNYKGSDKDEFKGFDSVNEAKRVLNMAIKAYKAISASNYESALYVRRQT